MLNIFIQQVRWALPDPSHRWPQSSSSPVPAHGGGQEAAWPRSSCMGQDLRQVQPGPMGRQEHDPAPMGMGKGQGHGLAICWREGHGSYLEGLGILARVGRAALPLLFHCLNFLPCGEPRRADSPSSPARGRAAPDQTSKPGTQLKPERKGKY